MNQTHEPPSAEAWQAFVARSDGARDGVVSATVPFGVSSSGSRKAWKDCSPRLS